MVDMHRIGAPTSRIVRALMFLCLLTLGLSACAGRGNNNGPDSGVVARVDDQDQPDWFCSPSENPDAWECQREEPETIRRPPSRTQQDTAIPENIVGPDVDGFSTPSPTLESPDALDGGIDEGGPILPPADHLTDNPNSTESDLTTAEPSYAKLAYQPERPTPILEIPGEFYAAQLFAVSTPEQVEEFVERENLYNMSAAQVEHKGELYYVLLLGIYETQQRAQEAVSAMPQSVQTLKPWIRPVQGLQAAMRRAQAVTDANGTLTSTATN